MWQPLSLSGLGVGFVIGPAWAQRTALGSAAAELRTPAVPQPTENLGIALSEARCGGIGQHGCEKIVTDS